ncbi:MAG: acyltransferase [Candidatus Levyibacteriota bacterium]
MRSERNYSIDFLKTAAIIAVVTIHVSTAFVDRTRPNSALFDVYVFINGLTRFAVPLFFLSSGLLLGARYNTIPSISSFYKKRVLRIFPPYMFWTLIYYVLFAPHLFSDLFSVGFINNFLTGDTSYQFYFIPTICVLYTVFPVFITFKKILLSKYMVSAVALCSLILLYFVYYKHVVIPWYAPFANALINISPFLIGVYLSEHKAKTERFLQKQLALLFSISIISGLTICFESLFLFKQLLNMDFVRNQWRPSVFIYALSMGGVLARIYESYFEGWNRIILWFSKYSFGVFFIHVAVMYPLLVTIDRYKSYGFTTFLIFLGITLSSSYVIIYVASKLPKVGKVISAS